MSDRELRGFARRMAALGLAIGGLLTLGTVGFVITEGVGVWDGFIWALDTVATVGSIREPGDTGGQVV
jgi:hypothetical protein